MSKRDRAKRLMKHYFHILAPGSDFLDWENDIELDELVDCLIDAAKEEMITEVQKMFGYTPNEDGWVNPCRYTTPNEDDWINPCRYTP
jgi:hypothetical protein